MNNKDEIGYDLRVDHFNTQLTQLINESGLFSSTVLYVLKDVTAQVENAYNQAVNKQYQDFCNAATASEKEKVEEKDPESAVSAIKDKAE